MEQYELQKLQQRTEEMVQYLVYEGKGLSWRLSTLIKGMGMIEFHAENVDLNLNKDKRLAKFGITPELCNSESKKFDLLSTIQKMHWRKMHKLAEEVSFLIHDYMVKSGRLQGQLMEKGVVHCL